MFYNESSLITGINKRAEADGIFEGIKPAVGLEFPYDKAGNCVFIHFFIHGGIIP
jgi:hypothetical protein